MEPESLEIRTAQTSEEVTKVQKLDTETWPEGFKHYKSLFALDPTSVVIAITGNNEVVSHVGLEKIHEADLKIGMPGWDHDPGAGWYKPSGTVWYITGHVVRKDFREHDLSRRMMEYVKEQARTRADIKTIAVMLRINHPTLGKASKFWEHQGFAKLEQTVDSEWKASPTATDSGGVIYAYTIR